MDATKSPLKRPAVAAASPSRPEKRRVAMDDITNIIIGQIPNLKPSSKPTEKDLFKSATDLHHDGSAIDRLRERAAGAPLLYHHLRCLEAEEERRPLPDYMEKFQTEVRPSMREILVDWLVEVADGFKLVSDTIYLTVNFIDRYLSLHCIAKARLQLLGVTCLLVASKAEEITPPRVEDCCFIADNAYTKEEVIAMESSLVKFLNSSTYAPTPKTFIRIFTEAVEVKMFPNQKFEFLVAYIAELSLTGYAFVKFLPSVVAASAIFIASFTLLPTMHPWSLKLQRYTGYKASELKECILVLHHIVLLYAKGNRPEQAVKDKYMTRKYQRVAALCPRVEIPGHYFEMVSE